MSSVFIFVDNMRIGGFQRLALDQAYGFSKLGYSTMIYVLDELEPSSYPNFLELESELLDGLNIRVMNLGKSRTKQLIFLIKLVCKTNSSTIVLSHSLRATFFLSVAKIRFWDGIKVITTIHQLPTLSGSRQRLQRFIYAQFSWKLFAYSDAVKSDWQARAGRNILFKFFVAPKRIEVLRNGIYTERLPQRASSSSELRPRLIYLGRNTSWKGVSTFLEIVSEPKLQNFDILFMIPQGSDLDQSKLSKDLLSRIQIVAGKTISSFEARDGDVHLYPANYGNSAKFIESVSLNCLELACLGVPTLLTQNGLGTWPDLVNTDIFTEIDWNDREKIVEEILKISKRVFSGQETTFIKERIRIENQINKIISLVK